MPRKAIEGRREADARKGTTAQGMCGTTITDVALGETNVINGLATMKASVSYDFNRDMGQY